MGDAADDVFWAERGGDDEPCPYCGDGDHVPAKGHWICPVCDAEWNEEDQNE